MIEPENKPETDFVQPTKGLDETKIKRDYNVSAEVVAQRKAAGLASANARREKIQNTMADKLDVIVSSMTPEEITDASFKDRATAAGIFYDKLYRDTKAVSTSAIQINIQTVGMDPKSVDPLTIDITPKANDTNVSL